MPGLPRAAPRQRCCSPPPLMLPRAEARATQLFWCGSIGPGTKPTTPQKKLGACDAPYETQRLRVEKEAPASQAKKAVGGKPTGIWARCWGRGHPARRLLCPWQAKPHAQLQDRHRRAALSLWSLDRALLAAGGREGGTGLLLERECKGPGGGDAPQETQRHRKSTERD